MPERVFREDWVVYAGFLMLLTGALDFFQGLIAIIKGQYYSLSPDQLLVVDLTTWGWIVLSWGSVVALAGVGLLFFRSNLIRWLAVAFTGLNVIGELGFAGGSQLSALGTRRDRAQHRRSLRTARALA
jgi:hypothetical protein